MRTHRSYRPVVASSTPQLRISRVLESERAGFLVMDHISGGSVSHGEARGVFSAG